MRFVLYFLFCSLSNYSLPCAFPVQQQGAFSEKDEQLRQILAKLDSIDAVGSLSPEDLTTIRRQLSEGQSMVRETVDRLRQSQEENEMVTRRRDELEARVAALETEYEELLGMFAWQEADCGSLMLWFTLRKNREDHPRRGDE